MVVIAANITHETLDLIDEILSTEKFIRFSLQNKLNLADKTILLRLTIDTFFDNPPTNEKVAEFKEGLRRPRKFDDYLKSVLSKLEGTNTVKN